MAYKDFPADYRSDEEIESIAHACRTRAASGHEWAPNIVELAKRLKAIGILPKLTFLVRPDHELPDDEARAFVDDQVIELRQSVYDGAPAGVPRHRMTVAHEIGHIVLGHRGVPKSRKPGAVGSEIGIPPGRSAERQATVFAARFLMLRAQVRQCSSVGELAERCNVSVRAAEIRFEQVNDREAAKAIPADIRAIILGKKLKPVDEQSWHQRPTTLTHDQQLRLAWETAPELANHDPTEFRSVGGQYAIRWSRRNAETPGGWRLSGGVIVPWEAERK